MISMHQMIPTMMGMLLLACMGAPQLAAQQPVRVAIARLTHDHVDQLLRRPPQQDIRIVGIYETDSELVERLSQRFGFDKALVHDDLENMLDAVKPEAVVAFGSIYEHLEVVEAAAPRGIHVMVEKPLAVSMEHAARMEELASEHGIHLLTNYETTWYPSVHAAYDLVRRDKAVGGIRKIVVHDGHSGPAGVVRPEFLEWLTDPVLNGGGALIDFGCYGANLATWLMNGAPPLTVTAVTQQLQPEVYPEVEDEATILLTYPDAQVIIQASWNWPFSRKDMEIYGQQGYIFAPDGRTLRMRRGSQQAEQELTPEALPNDATDAFSYLAAVVRGRVKVEDTDLSSLPNNLMVVRILDAARQSAQTGRSVPLGPS